MKYGFQETQDLVDFVVTAVSCWSRVYEDGTIDMADIPEFWDVFLQIGPLMENANAIPNEVKDLDSDELHAILEHIKKSIEITDEQAKELLDKVFVAIKSVYDVYLVLKD